MNSISVKNLTKYYGSNAVVSNVSFDIPQGSVCGFLGRNGAGKTTTIKMLVGLSDPTRGSASVLGCDCTALTPEIRARVGYVTEGHRLPLSMKIGQLEQFQRAFYPDQWNASMFNEMLDYFKLSRKKRIKSLSNGQRAQISLALTLAPNPELLIMDDPTLGLDPAVRRQFLESVVHLIIREGRTVLFSSHILSDVERVADRILVLHEGRLLADCSQEVFRESILKFIVRFPGGSPQAGPDAALNYRRGEHVMEITALKENQSAIEQWATGQQASETVLMPLTMEDQFIEFTEPQGPRNRLFSWEERDDS